MRRVNILRSLKALGALRSLMIAALAFTLAGCRHKDFCWHHPHGDIYVEVTYDDAGDADDALIIQKQISASRILSYHHEDAEMVLAADIDRGINILPLGEDRYHHIAYNVGTQSVSFTDHRNFYRHGVYTRECDILEPFYGSRGTESDIDLGNGEQVVIAVEPIWGAGVEGVACHIGDTIRLKANPLHCRYTYEMRNIDGLGGVVRASSFITGMSHGADLGIGELHDTPVTVAVPAQVGADGRSIVGSFMCFGQNPRIDTRHRMGLFLEFSNGARFKFIDGDHFDVTDQVVSAENRRRVHIVIDGIKIPATTSPDTGFEITVNPWTDGENKDLEYGF